MFTFCELLIKNIHHEEKIFHIPCLRLAAAGPAYAKSLVLTLGDGTLVYYLLGGDTNPKLQFVEGGFMLNADNYGFANVKNFYISNEDDPSGIENVLVEGGVEMQGNQLVIPTEGSVKVFTAAGKEVKAETRVVSGNTIVVLGTLPQGVYVVNVGGASIKIMKK